MKEKNKLMSLWGVWTIPTQNYKNATGIETHEIKD